MNNERIMNNERMVNNKRMVNSERIAKVEELIELCKNSEMNHNAKEIYDAAIEYHKETTSKNFLKLSGIIVGNLLEREQPMISGIESTRLFHKLIREIVD